MSLDFENLVTCYYRPLYQFALSLTQAESDACDLTQQTFYVWATKGHQLRDSSKVKSWLFTTLHREFLESRRRQTRFPHYELSQVDAELPTLDPARVNQLDSAQVLQSLAKVDQVYQAPVALFYLEQHSYKEIADILDVPMGTVKSRIARGIAQLQRALASPPGTNETEQKTQAKEILLLYREGIDRADDPEVIEALALAQREPELARWFEGQRFVHTKLRAAFGQIATPEGLKEQIVSERRAHTGLSIKRRVALAVTAVAAVVLLAPVLISQFRPEGENKNFSGFQIRMASMVLRAYPRMDLETSDLAQIHQYLSQHGRGEYVLPHTLDEAAGTGCKVLGWQSHPVSMICFNSAGISGIGSRRSCMVPSLPLETTMLTVPSAGSLSGRSSR